jgi:thiamine transport system permease protein
VPAAFVAVFFAYPVASILWRGLVVDGALDTTPVVDVVADPALRSIAWFTLWQAALSTVLTLVVGLPLAGVLARYRFPGRALVRALVTVPFVLPTIVVATAFLALLGPGGPLASLGWARGLAPILLAHVFFNVAVVVRTVGGFWSHLDPRLGDAARVLGASRLRVWHEVTLPLLAPAVTAAASIVFLFTFTSFGVVLLLGGPGRSTLEVEIYRATTRLLDLPTAAGLAIAQLAAVVAVLWVSGRLQDRLTSVHRRVAAVDAARRPSAGSDRLRLVGVLAGAALLLGAPIAVLVARSLDGGLRHYRALLETDPRGPAGVAPIEAVRNSVAFAALAVVLAVAIGGLAAAAIASREGGGRRALDVLVMLPLGTSAVTVGFGFLVALDRPPLDLRGSVLLVPIAQALVAIPFVVRLVVPELRAIDPRLREAAAVLGASPRRVWREVDLRIAARAFTVGAAFAAAISLGEFGATVFIARPDAPTVPVLIFRLLGRPGSANVGQAMALSVVLAALTALAVVASERSRVRDVGTF